MPKCLKCDSTAAYWAIRDKAGNTSHYCDPCFKSNNLADHKKKMDEFHRIKTSASKDANVVVGSSVHSSPAILPPKHTPGANDPEGLMVAKQIARRVHSVSEFVGQVKSHGFEFFEKVPWGDGVVLKRGPWKIIVGSWPGFGQDRIFNCIFRDETTDKNTTLFDEGRLCI